MSEKSEIAQVIAEMNKAHLSQMRELIAEMKRPAPENNKSGYEEVIFALQEAGLPTGVSSLRESLEKGVKDGVITIDDRDLAHIYLATHKKEISDFEQAMADRAATAKSVIEKKQNERYVQEHVCTHEHQAQWGGGSHCVLVRDNDIPTSPGYVLCQKCQARVRPDEPLMRKLDPEAIFNTMLYNRLLQGTIQAGQEMMA